MTITKSSGSSTPTSSNSNSSNGADAPMSTLQSFDFYTTAGNWNATSPWSISTVAEPVEAWRICDNDALLPWLQWQGEKNCYPFVPVTSITEIHHNTIIPVSEPVELTPTIIPSNATYKNIIWAIKDAGTTGATITVPNVLNVPQIGTVVISATIINGINDEPGAEQNYYTEFTIYVGPIIYIVDAPNQNGVNKFLWSELEAAKTALLDGWTMDITDAPTNAPAYINPTGKSFTLVGDESKTYPVAVECNKDLTLVNFKSSVATTYTRGIYLNTTPATATLTVEGECSIINTNSSNYGIVATKNLLIEGDGTLYSRGATSAMSFLNTAGTTTLTINANVTAETTTTLGIGLRFEGSTVVINGTGNLLANNTNTSDYPYAGIWLESTSAANLTMSGINYLPAATGNNRISLGSGSAISAVSLTLNLPNATTITGNATTSGIILHTSATGTATITNNGANVTFINSGTGSGINAEGNLTLGGTGKIFAKGGNRGIDLVGNTLTVNTEVTAEGIQGIHFLNTTGTTTLTINNNLITKGSSNQFALGFEASNVLINGSGTLMAEMPDVAGGGAAVYCNHGTTVNFSMNDIRYLTPATGTNRISVGNSVNNTATTHSLTFNLPQPTTFSVSSDTRALFLHGTAACNSTVTNNGAEITFLSTGTGSNSWGIDAMGNLTLAGSGKIVTKGGNRGINLVGNTLTVNTNVTAEGINYGIYPNNATTTISGTGNLTVRSTGNGTNDDAIRCPSANATLNINQLASLNITAATANGINLPGTGSNKLNINLPNITNITGGTGGSGVAFNGSAGSTHTFTNYGNTVICNAPTGIYSNYNLTFNGTGAINAVAANRGIYMFNTNTNITLSESVTVTAQGSIPIDISGTGRVNFSTVNHKLIVNNISATPQTVPCTKPAGTLIWDITAPGSIVAPATFASNTITCSLPEGDAEMTSTTIKLTELVPVTNIVLADNETILGTDLTLEGTVEPDNATFQTIVWSVFNDDNATGATISGNTLSATSTGSVTIRATIIDGLALGSNYTQNFTITIQPVAVTNITVANLSTIVGTDLSLVGEVTPTTATFQTIVWSVFNDDNATGASISGNILSATSTGSVTIRATIIDGLELGSNYTQEFTVTIQDRKSVE
jgi:hypothetical protein